MGAKLMIRRNKIRFNYSFFHHLSTNFHSDNDNGGIGKRHEAYLSTVCVNKVNCTGSKIKRSDKHKVRYVHVLYRWRV